MNDVSFRFSALNAPLNGQRSWMSGDNGSSPITVQYRHEACNPKYAEKTDEHSLISDL
jgi:hypothetical protein